jgi:dTDP-4-amino-4,6-dideoxygalactose transaminase
MQPALARFAKPGDTPIAIGLSARVLSLPMHHDLTEEHVAAVGNALEKVANAYRA